jgi:hypothetical protein
MADSALVHHSSRYTYSLGGSCTTVFLNFDTWKYFALPLILLCVVTF